MTDQEAGVRGYLDAVQHSFRIPAGSPERPCKVCPATIYFVNGLPISVESYRGGPPGYRPTALEDGAGIHHRATCPGSAKIPTARELRKKREARIDARQAGKTARAKDLELFD